ncbi:MAG: DUF2634 domain-containing protein [Chloroflexi bacterium]|nr:MAG: DUF2634 domain-containing protein [Chloroflexota bacterium]
MTTDLFLTRRAFGSQVGDRDAVDLDRERGDLRLVSGRENLAQAIVNRLLTRQGELTGLGHPDYGSRLYQLVGEPNTRRTQALAAHYIRESLAAETRIREVTAISFAPPSLRGEKRAVLDIQISVRLRGDPTGSDALTLSLTTNLEG